MNFKDMSVAELSDVIRKAQEEISHRKDKRYKELVDNVVSAWNLLYKEFPYTELIVETNDDYEIDVFGYFEGGLSANNFHR